MDALTPARRFFVPLRTMNAVASGQVSLIPAQELLNHSVSKHPMQPRHRFVTLPLSSPGLPRRIFIPEGLGFAIG